MAEPLILTTLRSKQVEIEAQIASLSERLAEAKADLFHVVATARLFDPTTVGKPATVYHGASRALRRSDMFDLCKAALDASPEPLDTRQLAQHVIAAEGWDLDDRRLRLTITHRVGSMMERFERRGIVQRAGKRDKATLWRLPE